MTEADARKVSDLLGALDDIRDWKNRIAQVSQLFIAIRTFLLSDDFRGLGGDGDLRLPVWVFAGMLAHAEDAIKTEFASLQVEIAP